MSDVEVGAIVTSDANRFWSKVTIGGPDECWEWNASKIRGGYGHFGIGPRGKKRDRYAHRVAYEFRVGPIPVGMKLDHLCRNTGCVNPSHLEPVTSGENTMRGTSFSAVNKRKTHCPKGHPYDAENTYNHNGRRNCHECRRIRQRRAGEVSR